jgi:hypothetical protein
MNFGKSESPAVIFRAGLSSVRYSLESAAFQVAHHGRLDTRSLSLFHFQLFGLQPVCA